jgi:glutathione-specific gamma-glutamylcyclotransferase
MSSPQIVQIPVFAAQSPIEDQAMSSPHIDDIPTMSSLQIDHIQSLHSNLSLYRESLYKEIISVLGTDPKPINIFAYGSLIFKPERSFSTPRRCKALGVKRRFYMNSFDHRGTLSFPGRVCALLSSTDSLDDSSFCEGILYTISSEDSYETITSLAEREKGGYSFQRISVCVDGNETIESAFAFVTSSSSPFLAPFYEQDLNTTAKIIKLAHGSSGSNLSYFTLLYKALQSLGIRDNYMEELNEIIIKQEQVE